VTEYNCCKGHSDIGHHSDCPHRRQAEALEEVAHKISKLIDVIGD